MGSHTEFLTLNTSEWPKEGVACSLLDTLETGDLPRRYFLSATACRGILRRAEKREKELPPSLKAALLNTARQTSEELSKQAEESLEEEAKLFSPNELMDQEMDEE
jgi:hypothetical protein